jgi:hypothetical protein
LGATAIIPWNPKRTKNRSRPPLTGWSAVASSVALTDAGVILVALAASDAGRPDLIRHPNRALAHSWEAPHELGNALS